MFENHRTMIAMALFHPAPEDFELSAVLHALSDPQRLHIVRELDRDPTPRPCGSFQLPVSKSTCTHHFRVLREAGVVAQHEVGTAKLTTLRRAELDARFPGLLDAVLHPAAASLAQTA
jgi:DNA-binding transcriptional ArsR family regulator